jgi:hypothetical protein
VIFQSGDVRLVHTGEVLFVFAQEDLDTDDCGSAVLRIDQHFAGRHDQGRAARTVDSGVDKGDGLTDSLSDKARPICSS